MNLLNMFRRDTGSAQRTEPTLGLGVNASTASSNVTRDSDIFGAFTGSLSTSGVAVTERSAMSVSAVYASVNLLGGALGLLPLPVYQRTKAGREKVDHDLWWLLNEQPAPAWSAAVMREYQMGSLLLQGDSFTRIHRRSIYSPDVDRFEPLHASRVAPFKDGNRLKYRVTRDDNTIEVIDQDDMLHIPGAGFDGLRGLSQIRHALRNPAGIAIAADQYSAAFFKNGAKPDFALETSGNLSADQQDMLRRTWSDRHSGASNSHLPALLVGGMKIHELTMNAEDAQLIETRKFQIEDIARIFGVPPFMIGATDKTTSWGSGVEQMGIGFVKYTLQRHLVKFEQELNRKLFRTSHHFVEFNTAGLERGDYKTRMEGFRVALGRAGEPGWMTVNEIRRLENMPPIEGGETLNGSVPNESPA